MRTISFFFFCSLFETIQINGFQLFEVLLGMDIIEGMSCHLAWKAITHSSILLSITPVRLTLLHVSMHLHGP